MLAQEQRTLGPKTENMFHSDFMSSAWYLIEALQELGIEYVTDQGTGVSNTP